ncbi:MAG: hypothetical protein ACR2OR_15390 [Hyphomicrobiales bacterium]
MSINEYVLSKEDRDQMAAMTMNKRLEEGMIVENFVIYVMSCRPDFADEIARMFSRCYWKIDPPKKEQDAA